MEEIKKIEKGKLYTYEQLIEIYKEAELKTLVNPIGKRGETDRDLLFIMGVSAPTILSTMRNNLFRNEQED